MNRTKISTLINRVIPGFVQEDHPKFVAFLKAYYDFLQQQGVDDLRDVYQLDNTLNQFIAKFKAELAHNFPNALVDQRFLLKHIKDFYASKGSDASFKFLFRALFDKEIEIDRPQRQMLRPSDGKWIQDYSIFVRVILGDPNLVVGKQTRVITSDKQVKLGVQKVAKISSGTDLQDLDLGFVTEAFELAYELGFVTEPVFETWDLSELGNPEQGSVYEVTIDRSFFGKFKAGDIFVYKDVNTNQFFTGYVMSTTSTVNVVSGGSGFKLGQLFDIETETGTGSVLKVSEVGPFGEIRALQFLKYGVEYTQNLVLTLNPSLDTPTTSISDNNIALSDKTRGFVEQGFVFSDYDYAYDGDETDINNYYWELSYSGDLISQFKTVRLQSFVDEQKQAVIRITPGVIAKYPGYYQNNDGFLSDDIYLQDSRYYQAFSYVIKVEETLARYGSIVKTIVHPAGMALFGEYLINNTIDLSLEIESDKVHVYDLQLDSSVQILDELNFFTPVFPEYSPDFPIQDVEVLESGGVYFNSYTQPFAIPGIYWDETYCESSTPTPFS